MPPQPSAVEVADHARAAASRAGLPVNATDYLPRDLGLVVYADSKARPSVYRDAPVSIGAAYIQPFVELHFEMRMQNTVRFLLIDSHGAVRLRSTVSFDVNPGEHTFLSPARLPVTSDLGIDAALDWTLAVDVGLTRVAEHPLNWYDPDGTAFFAEHLGADGELTADLAELVERAALNPMSLDDLLGDQPAQASRRKG